MYFKPPKEYISHIRRVHILLNIAGFTLRLKKYKYFIETIDYIGHVICSRFLEIVPRRTDARCGLQPVTRLTEPKPLPESCNVFELFNLNFACIIASLNEKRCKNKTSPFGTVSEKIMSLASKLRHAYISSPVFQLPFQLVARN